MKELIKALYGDLFDRGLRSWLVSSLISYIPGETGIIIRRKWYSKRFKSVGKNLVILQGTLILNPQNIECGDDVSIGIYNYIQAAGGLSLGSDMMTGPYAKIWTANHNFSDYNIPIRLQGYTNSPVEIGNGTWIGAGAFIMPGVILGSKCIVSACSVVGAKKYIDGTILAGHPARKIMSREPGAETRKEERESESII